MTADAATLDPDRIAADLREHAERCGIAIEPDRYEPLAKYCCLLWEWNGKINLTRHTTPELFVKRDLLDTWHLVQHIEHNERVLDFGSGCGVPGLTAVILRPDLRLQLCDSVQKKARVLEDIVAKLKLQIKVNSTNVTAVLPRDRFDTLTARAVGSISKMCTWLQPHWSRFGRLLTIKGPSWVDERGEARHLGQLHGINLRKRAEYPMPDRDGHSVILELARQIDNDSDNDNDDGAGS